MSSSISSEIPQFKVYMNDEEGFLPLRELLTSGYIGQGEKVELFEAALREELDFDWGVTVNSATSALWLALHLVGVGPGDEVVSTPMTCTATNMAILNRGANIVWADVDSYGNISPQSVQQSITPKTKAVMTVDWGGLPCDYDNLRMSIEHAPRRGYERVPIIEDAAHAIGAEYQGKSINRTGGDYIAYSFQAIKHLTTGDGGLLVTPEADYERAKLLRWYGFDRTQSNAMRCRQDVLEAGYKFHMNDINATIGLSNIKALEWILQNHRDNAEFYDLYLPQENTHRWPTNRLSSFWLYTIKVKDPVFFEGWMAGNKVSVSQTHNRNDVMTCFSESRNIYRPMPGLESYFSQMCCIPVGWWLSPADRSAIIDLVIKYNDEHGYPI